MAERKTSSQSPKILVAVDFSSASLAAVQEGATLAEEKGGSLYLLHVLEPRLGAKNVESAPQAGDLELAFNWAGERLRRIAENHVSPKVPVQTVVKTGQPSEEIIRVAQNLATDLILLGSPRKSLWNRLFARNTIAWVASYAPCPTRAVREDAENRIGSGTMHAGIGVMRHFSGAASQPV